MLLLGKLKPFTTTYEQSKEKAIHAMGEPRLVCVIELNPAKCD
jgi:hypothetical protein